MMQPRVEPARHAHSQGIEPGCAACEAQQLVSVFEFSGVVVQCWRCHDAIELLVEEDPNADHLCDGCAEWYGIASVADRI